MGDKTVLKSEASAPVAGLAPAAAVADATVPGVMTEIGEEELTAVDMAHIRGIRACPIAIYRPTFSMPDNGQKSLYTTRD